MPSSFIRERSCWGSGPVSLRRRPHDGYAIRNFRRRIEFSPARRRPGDKAVPQVGPSRSAPRPVRCRGGAHPAPGSDRGSRSSPARRRWPARGCCRPRVGREPVHRLFVDTVDSHAEPRSEMNASAPGACRLRGVGKTRSTARRACGGCGSTKFPRISMTPRSTVASTVGRVTGLLQVQSRLLGEDHLDEIAHLFHG